MAGPGDILGGLAQIGAIGAHGAYSGDIEGKVLGQNMRAQEAENQLRYLRLLQQQAAGMAPIGFGPGTLILDPQTGRTMQVPFAPKQPVSLGPGHTLVDPQTGQPMFSTPPTPSKPMSVSPGGSLVDPTTGKSVYTAPAAPQRPISLGPGHSLVDPTTGKSLFTLAPAPQRPISLGPGHNLVDPTTGRTLAQGPPSLVAGAGAPRETVTTTTKTIPRKEITNTDELNKVQADLESVTNEIAANPKIYGWMQPGAYVQVEGYDKPVRREDVIARAMLRKHGAGVSVRWDGKQWRLVRAWIPEQPTQVESRKTVGPPRPQGQAEDEE